MTLAFTYDALPGRVVFGAGALDRVGDEVDRLGAKRALVAAGPSNAATAARIATILGDRYAGLFDRVVQHTPIEMVREARAAAAEVGADTVICVGGGSTIGVGKSIALETGLPVIAAPTTYSGSEMTPIYGVTSEGVKRTGRDARVLPKVVIYDPLLTLTLPASVAGPSGMNALAHCVEALYAQAANPVTSLMAEEGARALAAGLPVVVKQPDDVEGRSLALYGAYLAGAALGSVGTAIHHRICHILGGTFGLGHGESNAVILPQAAAYNAQAAPEAMSRVARALGVADAPSGLFDLAQRIGAPTSLRQLGMPEDRLDEAARQVAEGGWNPRPVEFAWVRALLEDAYHGRRPSGAVFAAANDDARST